ncbi:MAG: anaerobic ribonucleoside-triphosphate reductase activating protein, partial [Aromatoleum sp.]|nr:anaerobic ribonucleoside-triphosphate reductase activating protein [Aromatoleum sp.]
AALASLDLVLAAGVAHEVRTTVHPTLTPPAAMESLARELAARGIERWVLQPFRATGCANADVVAAASRGTTLDDGLLARLSRHVADIVVRA